MLSSLKKAGRVVREALRLAEGLVNEEVSYLEVADKIEQFIIDNGCSPAFPVNISVNEIAAHYIPDIDDESKFKTGDVVKIDVGAHHDGWVVDAAITIEVNDNQYKDLIESAKSALDAVRKIIKKGVTLGEIGEVIESKITSKGYKPIYNLGGHEIKQYILHAGMHIPNYNNKSRIQIDKGIYAVEPFATTGNGFVKEAKPSKCYSIINTKVRNPSLQKFLNELYNKYKTLPFCRRWLIKEFNQKYNVDLYLSMLKRYNCIKEYSVLVEKSKGMVAQWETTFYINNTVCDLLGD